MNKLKQKSLENSYTNKLLEILGSSKVQSIETDISKVYDITEIEKYTEIRRITIYIKEEESNHYHPYYYYHGALIVPLKEPVEIDSEIRIPKILYKVDDIFILVLNKLIESWLLREQQQFIPEFKKVLKDNRIEYTINDSGIFYFKNGFEFSSLNRMFNNSGSRLPTIMEPKKVLDYMTELIKHFIIQKWKEGGNKQRLEKYVYLFPENKLDS